MVKNLQNGALEKARSFSQVIQNFDTGNFSNSNNDNLGSARL